MILIKYWRLLVLALLIGAVFAVWKLHGSRSYQAGYAAAEAVHQAKLAKAAQQQAEQARQASADYQTTKAENEQKERVRYVQVQKIIERPVYREHCLDADGLRELNAAIADSQ